MMVNVWYCSFKVSEFEFQSCYYVHFQINTLGKRINPSWSSYQWVKYYHCSSSTSMSLVLNSLRWQWRVTPHSPKFQLYCNLIIRLLRCLGCPRGVTVKAMNCGIVVREFVLQSRYYVHFRANTLGKGMNPLILPPAMGK